METSARLAIFGITDQLKAGKRVEITCGLQCPLLPELAGHPDFGDGCRDAHNQVRIRLTPTGVDIVQIGDNPTRKIGLYPQRKTY